MPGFHDVQFPTKIARGPSGGPRFHTGIVTSESGKESREERWDEPRLRYTVARVLNGHDQITELIAFFRCRAGKAYGFRFKDWSDYYVGMTWTPGTGLEVDEPVEFGTGDGVEVDFQLVKRYESGGVTKVRDITRPIAATVTVYVDDVEAESGWTLDDATGIVTFNSPPANDAVLTWAGEFDVPVRFDTDDLDLELLVNDVGGWQGIELIELRPGDQ